ncbi:hypothetical protein KQX54_008911 [Cotesia glomerata]|uniref:Secreted protein n=1 Tax=Cotesia glomerata TaxID=32391 RepID=A0AAV7I869_COTGL|nr:hypothetical protein KQX54_008911 [Cotesia glomerata]
MGKRGRLNRLLFLFLATSRDYSRSFGSGIPEHPSPKIHKYIAKGRHLHCQDPRYWHEPFRWKELRAIASLHHNSYLTLRYYS